MLERRDPQVEGDRAAQTDREGRDLGAPSCRSRRRRSRRPSRRVAVVVEERVEASGSRTPPPPRSRGRCRGRGRRRPSVRARIAARWVVTPGLVIRRAAAVEAVAAQGRLEGQRVPVGVVAGRLHVVVGVEQHRRASVAGRARGDDRRLTELLARRESAAGSTSTLSNTPSSRTSPAIFSALAWRCEKSKPSHETEGCARVRRGSRSPPAARPERPRGAPRRPGLLRIRTTGYSEPCGLS